MRVKPVKQYQGQKHAIGSKTDVKLGYVDYFRVTSRAHGNNKDTVVTLQTYLELLNKE